MKNHWLQVYKSRKSTCWTVFFVKSSKYTLKPRKAEVKLHHHSVLVNSKPSAGEVVITFRKVSSSDNELFDFLSDTMSHNLTNQIAKAHLYKGISEIESYEFSDLNFININWIGFHFGMSQNDDVELKFEFNSLKHFKV